MVLDSLQIQASSESSLSAKASGFIKFLWVATLLLGLGCSATESPTPSGDAQATRSDTPHSDSSQQDLQEITLLTLDEQGLEVRAVRRDSNVFICWESYGACFLVSQKDSFSNERLRRISSDKYIVDYVRRHAPQPSAIVTISNDQ